MNLDTRTGLMWQKCSLGLMGATVSSICDVGVIQMHTWLTALKAANADTGYGYSDWRLPNVNELASLIDTACFSPAINETLFPATSNNDYWTSTPFNTDVNYVYFLQGDIASISNNRLKNLAKNVRLVRGLQ
ncbi:protein of unknown function DUF1566 [hydrothermal vent metagenome]|uniref:Lcl C-terminal domain-containing protein n=1 Tax=hydrothermal vent metagenome TaxID=652676 RepID=A0A3B0WLT8_9ZZZZ